MRNKHPCLVEQATICTRGFSLPIFKRFIIFMDNLLVRHLLILLLTLTDSMLQVSIP